MYGLLLGGQSIENANLPYLYLHNKTEINILPSSIYERRDWFINSLAQGNFLVFRNNYVYLYKSYPDVSKMDDYGIVTYDEQGNILLSSAHNPVFLSSNIIWYYLPIEKYIDQYNQDSYKIRDSFTIDIPSYNQEKKYGIMIFSPSVSYPLYTMDELGEFFFCIEGVCNGVKQTGSKFTVYLKNEKDFFRLPFLFSRKDFSPFTYAIVTMTGDI